MLLHFLHLLPTCTISRRERGVGGRTATTAPTPAAGGDGGSFLIVYLWVIATATGMFCGGVHIDGAAEDRLMDMKTAQLLLDSEYAQNLMVKFDEEREGSKVIFDCFGRSFSLLGYRSYLGEGGRGRDSDVGLYTYQGEEGSDEVSTARFTIFHHKSKGYLVKGYFIVASQYYFIEPVASNTASTPLSSHLIIKPASEVSDKQRRNYEETSSQLPSSLFSFFPPISVCPLPRRVLPVHAVVDHRAFHETYGNDTEEATADIISLWHVVDGILERTINLKIVLMGITIKTASGDEGSDWNSVGSDKSGWNDDFCSPLKSQLNSFSFWRGQQNDRESRYYHLFTGCLPLYGPSSLSWLNGACIPLSGNTTALLFTPSGSSTQWVTGAGVSYLKRGIAGYTSVLRELGYCLGSGKTNWGIMAEQNTNYTDGFSRVSQVAMCHLGRSLCGSKQTDTVGPTGISTCIGNCSGIECGDDGCGGFCGSCSGPTICQAGLCTSSPPIIQESNCIPTVTCEAQFRSCGFIPTGCPIADMFCGACPVGSSCTDGGHCKCIAGSCETLNAQCGTIDDGCGQTLHCGDCSSEGNSSVCSNNLCTDCTPMSKEVACASKTCGTAYDGCNNQIVCGSCYSTESCTDGQCIPGTPQCSPYGTYSTLLDKCICLDGFIGDGVLCKPDRPIDSCDPNSFSPFGNVEWYMIKETCSIHLKGNTNTSSCKHLDGSLIPFCPSGLTHEHNLKFDQSFSQHLTIKLKLLPETKNIGIFLNGDIRSSFISSATYLTYSTETNILEIGMITPRDDSTTSWDLGKFKFDITLPINREFEMGLAVSGCVFKPIVDNQELPAVQGSGCRPASGKAGIIAEGPVEITSFTRQTSANFSVDVFGCISKYSFQNQLLDILSLQVNQIPLLNGLCFPPSSSSSTSLGSSLTTSSSSSSSSFSFILQEGSSGTIVTYKSILTRNLELGTGGIIAGIKGLSTQPREITGYIIPLTTTTVSLLPPLPPLVTSPSSLSPGVIGGIIALVIILIPLILLVARYLHQKLKSSTSTLTLVDGEPKKKKPIRPRIFPTKGLSNWQRAAPRPQPRNSLPPSIVVSEDEDQIPIMYPVNMVSKTSSVGKFPTRSKN